MKLIASAIAAITLNASAGLKTTDFVGASTNIINSSVSSNYTTGALVQITSSKNLAIQTKFALQGAGTTACTFTFDKSIDNSNWITNAFTFSVTPAGTATVALGTNIDVGAFPFWRLGVITNGSATVMTNIWLKYYYKLGL